MSAELDMLRAELAEVREELAEVKAALQAVLDRPPPAAPVVHVSAPTVNVEVPQQQRPEVHVDVAAAPAQAATTPGDAEITHHWEGNRIVRSSITHKERKK